ncbi:MAG: GldG family protein [Verrucomicrobiota bacterium]
MPEQPSSAPRPSAPPGSIHRMRVAFNVAVQLILLLVIFVTVNYLSCRHHRHWDLTQNQRFTLSSATTNFLDSLSKDADVIVAFSTSSPLFADVKALVEEYQRYSDGHITIEMLDPVRNPSRATDVRERFDLQLDSKRARNAIIISTGENTRLVTEEEMLLRQSEAGGKLIGFRGEEAVTAALIATVEQDKRRLYVASGHRRLDQAENMKAELSRLLERQNAEIVSFSLAESGNVPEDCSTLIILAPSSDFNPDEMRALREYWIDRKGSLLVLLDPAASTPNLYAFLREFGAPPRNDRLLSLVGKGKSYNVPAVFLPGSPITKDLIGIETVFPGITQSLHVLPNDGFLESINIEVTPLIVADSRFWGETDYQNEIVTFDELTDNTDPLYLAASVEKDAVADPNLRVDSSRMVVVGNANLLDLAPRRIKTNHDFVLSSINWLLDRRELIGIAPKSPTEYTLTLTPKQFSRIQTIVLFILPIGAFFLAIAVWAARRA